MSGDVMGPLIAVLVLLAFAAVMVPYLRWERRQSNQKNGAQK